MSRITRDDIQRIGDEDTLLHFLEEKLNLLIPEGATLAQIALPLPLPFLGLDNAIAEEIIDCQNFSGLPKDGLGERRPFLIRFKRESGYSEILREVAEGLFRRDINPAEIFFICADEDFRPFAFAYFSDSEAGNWATVVLNILAWTQDNTHIHVSAEHELPTGFFADIPAIQPITPTSSESLISKIENIGSPLSRSYNVYTGCFVPGRAGPFVIDDSKRQELIKNDEKSSEIIKRVLLRSQQKWTTESACLIEIPSSHKKQWPWSTASNEAEAEQIFTEIYPAVSTHLNSYSDRLKARVDKGKFWWELKSSNQKVHHRPKIVYPSDPHVPRSMKASYDKIGLPTQDYLHSIDTTDLSLLAILNSKFFNWYAHERFMEPVEKTIFEFSEKKHGENSNSPANG